MSTLTSRNKIAIAITSQWGRLLASSLIGLFQTPLLFMYLKASELGVWYLLFSFINLLALTDLGMPQVLGRAVAYVFGRLGLEGEQQPVAAERYRDYTIPQLYDTALIGYSFLCVTITLIGAPFVWLYLNRPALGVSDLPSLVTVLVIFLFGTVFNLLIAIPRTTLQSLGDMAWGNGLEILGDTFWLLLILFFVPRDPRLLTLVSIYGVKSIFVALMMHILLQLRHRWIFQVHGGLDLELLKRLFREGQSQFISRLAYWFASQSTLVIGGFFLQAREIPNLAILRQLVNLGGSIPGAIPQGVFPFAALSFAGNQKEEFHKIYHHTKKVSFALMGLWVIGATVWGPTFLDLWVGPGRFLGYPVLLVLLLTNLLDFQHWMHTGFVWVTGIWPFAKWYLFCGILNLFLSAVGCHYFGVLGLVIGSLISQLLTYDWFAVYFTLHHIGDSVVAYLRWFGINFLTYLSILGLCGFWLKSWFEKLFKVEWSFRSLQGGSLISLMLGSLSVSIIAGLICYLLLFNVDDRKAIINFINKRWKYLRHDLVTEHGVKTK